MQRIATRAQLQHEIQRILSYAEGDQPSREVLAHELNMLADSLDVQDEPPMTLREMQAAYVAARGSVSVGAKAAISALQAIKGQDIKADLAQLAKAIKGMSQIAVTMNHRNISKLLDNAHFQAKSGLANPPPADYKAASKVAARFQSGA